MWNELAVAAGGGEGLCQGRGAPSTGPVLHSPSRVAEDAPLLLCCAALGERRLRFPTAQTRGAQRVTRTQSRNERLVVLNN